MFFRQLYDDALAQASYLIGCQATGEAIVVDPLRDAGLYLEVAKREGLRITHVTETHIHADFVSGARELHAATGARLYLSAEGGRDWQYEYAATDDAILLRDGDHFMVGNIRFDVLHTPGHTPEHLSFLVTDTPRAAGPMGLLTGDFVFVGDVGRPDLLERAAKIANTMEEGAQILFASLQRIRSLPDHLQIWPGHGAGSACGKALGAVPSTTLGYEKLANWGVAATDEAMFVQQVLDGQPEPPRYFAEMKRINKVGPPVIGALAPLTRLESAAVLAKVDHRDIWPIDLRSAAAFAAGHLPGSLSVAYTKSFSTWVGSLIPYSASLILIADPDPHGEIPASVRAAQRDLSRIGIDGILGWIEAPTLLKDATLAGIGPATMPQREPATVPDGSTVPVVDVRGRTEWEAGHVPSAQHIPLGELPDRWQEIPDGEVVVHCQSGVRSAIATSYLRRVGKRGVVNLIGGYAAWRAR
jgi:hydroxyacylglutathione hydrolase